MIKALVPLAQGCEEMEAVIILDTLRRAQWEVLSAGLDERPVTASRRVVLMPDAVWSSIQPAEYDLLVIPGGAQGVKNLRADARVVQAARQFFEAGKLVAAVCAGPLVLQDAGLLQGRPATCHPSVAAELATACWQDKPVVVDGNLVTSQGPGTSFRFALTLIALKDGVDKAAAVARAMILSDFSL